MAKIFYHATDLANIESIVKEGIRPSIEGYAYVTETPEDAIKFLLLRGLKRAAVFSVRVDDPEKIVETFDHSSAFFKCRCFGYLGGVPTANLEGYSEWELKI